MSLRINTNVAALNSYNNLNANQSKLEGAFQQLSSGLRINKAADDAAGLSIAQGLTSQINGLTQAVSNANDGINVAQIADGALGTTQDILQRMRGLIVKAGNEGTQDSKSLGAIQQEIQNLNTQLNNISSQTKFGQTNLLDGSYDKNFQVGANGGDTIKLDLSKASVSSSNIAGTGVNLNDLNIASTVTPAYTAGYTPPAGANGGAAEDAIATALGQAGGTAIHFGAVVDGKQQITLASDATTNIGQISFDDKSGVYTVTDAGGKIVAKVDTAAGHDATFASSTLGGAVAFTGTPATDGKFATWLGAADGSTGAANAAYTFSGNATTGWTVNFDGDTTDGTAAAKVGFLTVSNGVYSYHDGTSADADTAVSANGRFSSNAELTDASGISSYSSDAAASDLDKLDSAIGAISNARSQIGAVQNQLGYTVSNLQTAITNVTASRSNLTDADLAQQVTAMTQSQILTQAATSVLAQANSAPQAILKLLQ